MTNPLINFLIIIIALFLLSIASYHDIRTRMISDWIWICIMGSGLVLHLLQLIITIYIPNEAQDYLFNVLFNLIIAALIAILLTLSALGGEADRIAFFAVAFVIPIQQPIFSMANPEFTYLLSFLPKILGIFFNAYLVAAAVPIFIFFYNFFQKRRKRENFDYMGSSKLGSIFLHFIGYPKSTMDIVKVVKDKPWHFDFLEVYKNDEWKINFNLQLDTPEADFERKLKLAERLENDKKEVVWVQPSLPFISFISIGYVLEILVGNIILSIMSFIF